MVKTIAVRLEDELHAQLVIVAHLFEQTVTETIRLAIESYLERQRSEGDLAARAEALVAEIDREAEARRRAIEDLLGEARGTDNTDVPEDEKSPKRRRGSGPKDKPEADPKPGSDGISSDGTES